MSSSSPVHSARARASARRCASSAGSGGGSISGARLLGDGATSARDDGDVSRVGAGRRAAQAGGTAGAAASAAARRLEATRRRTWARIGERREAPPI